MTAKKFHDIRISLGYTQSDLGEVLGMSWGMISRIENGRSGIGKSIKIAMLALEKLVDGEWGDMLLHMAEAYPDSRRGFDVARKTADPALMHEWLSLHGFYVDALQSYLETKETERC